MKYVDPTAPSVTPSANLPTTLLAGWQAYLKLVFAQQQAQTRLISREHHGPLVIQKLLQPQQDNVAHGVILHPPGGIAGGDRLQLSIALQPEAKVLLTTPGATKWYKSAGRLASQQVEIELADRTQLEWLPQENIVFDNAQVRLNTQVSLAATARFASWEIVSLGRRASGERWQQGAFSQRLTVYRQQQLIWSEATLLKPDSLMMTSAVGLGGQTVFGSLIVAAGKAPEAIVSRCREITVAVPAQCGVSALPEIFVARYIGDCPQQARQYFEQLWRCLRPWYADRQAIRPRIWAT